MPSTNNLPGKTRPGKPEFCVFCRFSILWLHAYNHRKGAHLKTRQNSPNQITVIRWLCKNPKCHRTFSVMPYGTLPYCRFKFEDFLDISCKLQEGASAFSLWKAWPDKSVSLKVFVRLRTLIKRVQVLITAWAREMELSTSGFLDDLCRSILMVVSWFNFTTRWYHALYPSRLWSNPNPHNLEP